jgi:hypothetical protein
MVLVSCLGPPDMGTVDLSGLCPPSQGCTFHFWGWSTHRGVSVLPCDMVRMIVLVCSCIIVCYLWWHIDCVLYVSLYFVCSLWFYLPHMLPQEWSMSTMWHGVTGLYYDMTLCYSTVLLCATVLQDCTKMCHHVMGLSYDVPLCYRTVLQYDTVLQDCTTIWHCVTGLYNMTLC